MSIQFLHMDADFTYNNHLHVRCRGGGGGAASFKQVLANKAMLEGGNAV